MSLKSQHRGWQTSFAFCQKKASDRYLSVCQPVTVLNNIQLDLERTNVLINLTERRFVFTMNAERERIVVLSKNGEIHL